MKRTNMNPENKARARQAAWRQEAPEATFAQNTLVQYEAMSQAVADLDDDIFNQEKLLVARKATKRDAVEELNTLNKQVVNSIKGTPGYGDDSPLYRACGYVRASERKSGYHRLPTTPVVLASHLPTMIPSGMIEGVTPTTGSSNAA
jgi:hypothetical protein